MISSRNALSSLEHAIRGVRRDEDNLAAVLRNASKELAELRTQQAEAFRTLARLRLDAIKQGEVIGQIDAVEAKALGMIEQWQKRLDEAMADRSSLQNRIAAAEEDRLKKVDAVEGAVHTIDDLKEAAESEIEADDEWRAEHQKLAAAAAVAKAADEKAANAEADFDNKGRPYKADSLFMYLWNAGYGTSRYRAGALTRFFDGRIARLIGYETARQDYHMLTEIPKKLRQHAQYVAEKAEAEEITLEAIERRLLEARGIGELEDKLEKAHGVLTKAENRLSELRVAFEQRAEEDKILLDPERDSTYRDAVEMLARTLEREDLDRLWREAKQTRTTEDEGLISQLEKNFDRVRDVDRQIAETRQAIVELAEKRAELEHSRDRFYRSGYDDPIGGFSNGDMIGEVIGGILAGAIKSRQLDDLFDQGYRQRRRRSSGSLGGGIRFPSGPVRGPWTGGGSIGGPRGPSRPGGFRTTGGF
jgi:chromosome segregation ATPase